MSQTSVGLKTTVQKLLDKTIVSGTLFSLDKLLNALGAINAEFKQELAKMNITVQLKLRDNTYGRWFRFKDGTVEGHDGINKDASVEMIFEDEDIARRVTALIRDQAAFANAAKQGALVLNGPDAEAMWFSSLLLKVFAFDVLYLKNYGTKMANGEMRYVQGTNRGPLFVYVKDGKIVRITPMDFDEEDADPWTIKAHGKKFTPPKRVTTNACAQNFKSMIYSPNRILYPMKRVDFDPKNGNRNTQNRGISGYERISWDEALDFVADEIKRVRQTYGCGAVFGKAGGHHMWGNIGNSQSSSKRFFNCIGATMTELNPDSWEGWAWGAVHTYGQTARNGSPEPYNTVEDCMQNADMIVYWSSDPETTAGVYAGQEGTIRREWLKDLDIKVVHIDPYMNSTATFVAGRWICPRPNTDVALAVAIANVWMHEGLYDKDYVKKRTYAFDKWEEYVTGKTDGIDKTPEWQEDITGVPARTVRNLARYWGTHKVYLAAGGIGGFGSACRGAFGTEWARVMVCLVAMQGYGKPGINFGGLQYGTPLDTRFYFPGYADGGFSGDYMTTGAGVNMYNRSPQSPSLNSETQSISRLLLPEALMEGHAEWNARSSYTVQAQFNKKKYPANGHAGVKMYYNYGGSNIGTQPESKRYAKMFRCDTLETIVNQSIWFEGEAKFADIILPACTNFERWDIGEAASCGGYIDRSFLQNNYRVIFVQHKCIEPLGESKSDFDIFQEIANRLGLWQVFSEGNSQYDWVKRQYEASDMVKIMPWSKFIKKGYYVVPPLPENRRDPVAMNWYAEGRKKDTPEITPIPAEYYGQYGMGMQTPSGLIEFESQPLKRFDPDDEERRPICTYIHSWEGVGSVPYTKYKLQLISPHAKFSMHTMGDLKDSFVNDIDEHRMLIDGHRFWIFRMNPKDAEARGLKDRDIVEVYNDRGRVLCGLHVTERVPEGTVHSCESCADYKTLENDPGGENTVEIMGCINNLTPKRFIAKNCHGMAANSCLVEVKKWEGGKVE